MIYVVDVAKGGRLTNGKKMISTHQQILKNVFIRKTLKNISPMECKKIREGHFTTAAWIVGKSCTGLTRSQEAAVAEDLQNLIESLDIFGGKDFALLGMREQLDAFRSFLLQVVEA